MSSLKQVEYWCDLAKYDMETAKAMLETERFLYVGFMCHQVIEKALKAFYSFKKNEAPPYIHNLLTLAEKAELYKQMSESQKDFLDFLTPLNIEARYPMVKDRLLNLLNKKKCVEVINQTEEALQWIIKKLS